MARAWVYGDNISTDDIIAGRYLAKHEGADWGKHAMENIDPKFSRGVKQGDVIVAGKNFGCGSSREQAPIALKQAGVSAVVAESFARIFYRNSINQGLPVLTCLGAKDGFKTNDPITVDIRGGIVKNGRTGKVFKAQPLPKFIMDILEAGGMITYTKRKMKMEMK